MSALHSHFNDAGEDELRGRTGRAGLLGYAEHILERSRPPQGASILDVGCGDGAVLRTVKELRPDLHCTGVDFAEKQIAKAKSPAGQGLEFYVANLLDGTLEVGRFDRIYSFGVIQYFKEQQFLRICRMLRSSLLPGGTQTHCSIPDLRKRALHIADFLVNVTGPGALRTWLLFAKLTLVDVKRTLTDDVSYGADSQYHDAEKVARALKEEFAVTVLRPSDSWYRFDLQLVPQAR